MSSAQELTAANFDNEVARAETPVLVDFWAAWCGPCRMVGPIVDELAREYAGRLKVGKVDVDAEPRLAAHFGIQSIPTLLVFSDGQIVDQIVGAAPKAQLAARLERVLGAVPAGR
ncbi:MAG: thioredoxin [Gemmatimonadota bacterium]